MKVSVLKKKIKKTVDNNDALLTVQVDEEMGVYNVFVRLNLFDSGDNEYIKVDSFFDLSFAKEFAEVIQEYCKSQNFKNVEVNDDIEMYCEE